MDRVAAGEDILITRHKPRVRLSPAVAHLPGAGDA
jgi:antitoxin (DNA-binding transcriptional repressor) of toxin-antitoxin stability system